MSFLLPLRKGQCRIEVRGRKIANMTSSYNLNVLSSSAQTINLAYKPVKSPLAAAKDLILTTYMNTYFWRPEATKTRSIAWCQFCILRKEEVSMASFS